MNDAVFLDVNLFATGRKSVSPSLVQFLKSGGELNHISYRELAIVDVVVLHIGLDPLVSGDVSETEDKFLCVSFQLIADVLDFAQ